MITSHRFAPARLIHFNSHSSQFWCYETKESAIQLLPGKNYLTARFEGTEAKLVNLDTPALKFMNSWLGKVESNTLILDR